jgi:hypothetical protein
MAYGVKRYRRKYTPQRIPAVQRRALEIIATHPDGSSEAILAVQNIPADVLIELVQSGLATARRQRVDEEDEFLEVTTLWITAVGDVALAARW